MRPIDLFIPLLLGGAALFTVVGPKFVGAPNMAALERANKEEVAKADKVTILAIGDVMLGRYVGTLAERHGARYPFAKLDGLFEGHDHILLNLEGPITDVNLYPNENPRSTMKFRFAPSVAAATLRDEGVTAANLANNHSLDQGSEGFRDTQESLREAGILYSGSATNDPAFFGVPTTTHGVPILFIGFNATWPHDSGPVLAYLKAQRDDVFIVVSVHWGEEYQLTQNEAQRTLAHAFVDAGADIVVGHHPHVVQGIEAYHDKLIFYSLGNFIFDQYFQKEVEEGLALAIEFTKIGGKVKLVPIQSRQSQPMAMEDEPQKVFLKALAERSDIVLSEQILSGELMLESK